MHSIRIRLAAAALATTLTACSDSATGRVTAVGAEWADTGTTSSVLASADAGVHRRYGTPIQLGEGRARSYVTIDQKSGAPIELGVALDERALDGLPAPGSGHGGAHGEMHEYILSLPPQHGTPFQFVELDWNPLGHELPGIYTIPHFDFHFYTITKAERDAIDPATNPNYESEGNNVPAPEYMAPFHAIPLPPGVPPVVTAVPRMGLHYPDLRSPELQGLLGNPDGYREFTTTFNFGAWNGRITFWEPMITRQYIVDKKNPQASPEVRDEIIPLPIAQKFSPAGYYPSAYRIMWDAQAREYRIALTQLSARD
jgi:hypothetical protein